MPLSEAQPGWAFKFWANSNYMLLALFIIYIVDSSTGIRSLIAHGRIKLMLA